VSIKQGIELKQLLKDVEVYNIYIDIRTFGLWEQLYWESMEEHGVNYIRGRVSQIFDTGKQLLVKGEDTLVRGPFEVLMDMVVLAVGRHGAGGQGARPELQQLRVLAAAPSQRALRLRQGRHLPRRRMRGADVDRGGNPGRIGRGDASGEIRAHAPAPGGGRLIHGRRETQIGRGKGPLHRGAAVHRRQPD
jgi:hypothetical protein